MNPTNPATEVETTDQDNSVEAVEEEVTDQSDTTEEGQDADSAETEETATDDIEEIEIEGERYQLPKNLKDKFMMHADYTRKTSEVAETKRQLEAREAEFKRNQEVQQQHIKDYAELHAIDAQLQHFQGINWTQLINDDPVQAQQLQRQEIALRDAREARVKNISQREQETALKKQQETAKRIQEGNAYLQREIKGWSPEYAQKLIKHGKEAFGLSDEYLSSVDDPKQVMVMHKAYLYDQLIKKQSQKPKAPEAKPVKKVGGTAKAGSSLPQDSDPIDVWMKKEQARMAKKRL